MNDLSGDMSIKANGNDTDDVSKKMLKLRQYFDARLKEIENRIASGNRSIFDFVDMAVVIAALSGLAENCDREGNRFRAFVKRQMLKDESGADDVSAALYALMRCGLIHSMSLSSQNKVVDRNGYSVSITHNKSESEKDAWYEVLPDEKSNKKKLVLHAKEFLDAVKNCVKSCFENNLKDRRRIEQKIKSSGVHIVEDANEKA